MNYVDRIVRKSKILKINNIEFIAIIIDKCLFIDFVIFDEINDKSTTICFIRYVYLINNLKINIFLNNDILKSKNIVFYIKKNY